jgi:hypothetical protein
VKSKTENMLRHVRVLLHLVNSRSRLQTSLTNLEFAVRHAYNRVVSGDAYGHGNFASHIHTHHRECDQTGPCAARLARVWSYDARETWKTHVRADRATSSRKNDD